MIKGDRREKRSLLACYVLIWETSSRTSSNWTEV
jgi:hypothetical protein